MNHTPNQSLAQPASRRAFLAGLALGTLLAFAAALHLALLGYARLDPQSHWPLAVLISNAANLIRFCLQPSSFFFGAFFIPAIGVLGAVFRRRTGPSASL